MQDRVKGPAIGLIITGAVGILLAIVNLVGQGALMEWLRSMMPADQAAQAEASMQANTLWTIVMTAVNVLASGFILYGGLQMQKLQSRTLVLVASIVAMVPCFACCLIGLPIGIWSLIVLSKPEVKQAFTS